MHIALELSNQERFDEANFLFEQVEALLPGASDEADRARYLSYQALRLANQHKFEKARERAAEATKLRKNMLLKWDFQGRQSDLQSNPMGVVGLPPDAADVVQSLYIEAAMLRRLGKTDEAEQVYREAKSTLHAAKRVPPLWTPQLEALGARITDSNNIKEARLGEAIDLWKVYAPGERPGALDYIEAGANYRAQGRLDDALVAFKTGIDLIRGRGSLSFEQLLPYFKTALELSESFPARRDELNKQMFEAGQLVRGSRTRQDITRAAVRLGAENPYARELIRKLQDAENASYIHRRSLAAEKIWSRGKVVQQYQERLDEELAIGQRTKDAKKQVQVAYPNYNLLIDSVVDADEVLTTLKSGEALVQVLLGNTESLLFLVRDGTISAYRLEVTEEEVNSTIDVIIQGGLMNRNAPLDVAAAYRLYQRLFSNVSTEIKNAKHLITVPTGALLSLPYGLLVTEDPSLIAQQDAPAREGKTTQRGVVEVIGKDGTRRDYTNVAWLAKTGAISLAPSVRSFVDLRRVDRSRATKALVGFGDPVPFPKILPKEVRLNLPKDCRENPNRVEEYLSSLQELKGSKKELSNISGMFPAGSTDLVLSKEFTEQKVKTYPLQDYRIVYFATHGLLPGALQCQPEPSLVTSPSDSTREGDEGLIDASEILHLKLDADLVVLSACNTGGPGAEKEIRGESLSGLARAFFFAGARSVLASHWYLPDEETAGLMIDTFKNLYNQSDPKGLTIALNLAQRELMNDQLTSHPFYWAGFSLVGNGARSVSPLKTQ
jgi:CHAT domain-containing protein